jgi:hypothetical protein
MAGEAVGASEAGGSLNDFDLVQKLDGRFFTSLNVKGQHSGVTAFLLNQGQRPIEAGVEQWVVNLNDPGMSLKKFGNLESGQIVPLHPDLQRWIFFWRDIQLLELLLIGWSGVSEASCSASFCFCKHFHQLTLKLVYV